MLKRSSLKIDPEFSSRQEALIWICNHQLGHRNLTPERRKYLIGKRYEVEKQVSQNRGNQYTSAKKNGTDQNDPCQNKSGSHVTRQRIANETGTSEGYVQRAEKYMNGVEAADEAVPGAREGILNGKIKAADREICAIAKAPKEQRSEIVAELRKPKSERDKQLASSTKSPSAKVESVDGDGSRFLIGISKKCKDTNDTKNADRAKTVQMAYKKKIPRGILRFFVGFWCARGNSNPWPSD